MISATTWPFGNVMVKVLERHQTLSWIAAVIAFLYFVYLAFFEPPFLVYKNVPFPVVREPAAGEPVLLEVTRCNSSGDERIYAISHNLVSLDDVTKTQRYVLTPGVVSLSPGCRTETSAANVIPAGTVSGLYRVEGLAEVSGTIRTTTVKWSSAPFRVKEATK